LILHANCFKPILFADDTNLFFETKFPNNDATTINEGLKVVKAWCSSNKLTLNSEKTQYIVIKNWQNSLVLSKSISINNVEIKQAESIKFLGITIDPNLTWSAHIEKLRAELRQSLGLIYLASSFLPRHILILLYNCLINSKIVYCLEAWGNAPKTHINKIMTMQKRVIRVIFRKHSTYHAAPLFKQANILPVQQLYTQRICLLAHDTFYNQTETNRQPSHYNTRHSKLSLPLPAALSACGQRQVTYQVAGAWNDLPAHLREIQELKIFRLALKQHLLASLD